MDCVFALVVCAHDDSTLWRQEVESYEHLLQQQQIPCVLPFSQERLIQKFDDRYRNTDYIDNSVLPRGTPLKHLQCKAQCVMIMA